MKLGQAIETALCLSAQVAWPLLRVGDALAPPAGPFHPRFSDQPIPRGEGRTSPPLGWPRETDSLCPECVRRARARICCGEADLRHLTEDHPGEIRARILERDGKVVIEKDCPEHGHFEDVLSIDPAFLERIERLFPGRDVSIAPDRLHDHGASSLRYGRGGVLTIDLTSRCNLRCEPCFADSNQAGFVHELGLPEIRRIIDDAVSVRPRRQMSLQLSGGEPTLSPHFLEAVRYAKERGFFCVQCATNGLRFAQEPGFARQCRQAGLRLAYLQLDGVTNAANSHRNVSNLYDVKLRAIEELAAADIDVVLVVTVVRGLNDDQVGPIVEFAVQNADKITVVSFQPVSFSGRDELISDEQRREQRYTLSHLVHDVAAQAGVTHPQRDWFPLSALSPFGDLCDLLDGGGSAWGQLKCACHPHCGVGTILFVHKRTGQMIPLCDFLDLEGVLGDVREIFDAGRGPVWTKLRVLAALLRHYRPERAPAGFSVRTLLRQFLSQAGVTQAGHDDAKDFDWRVLFVAGMWFQDLYTYDLRRTEMCIIPYGTELGEISFCAYNTGIGWRHVIEQRLSSCPAQEWYREHGRHPIHAGGRAVPLPPRLGPPTVREHRLALEERRRGPAAEPRHKPKAPRNGGRRLPWVA
ncbi:MAG: radical SAM protein [Deltaproteobacteria bacterium]|nr:radical SAM protein [Deltaproteobacteria bacterium]